VEKAVVLICYPENAFGDLAALRAFMCTDMALGSETIIRYYTNRWKTEVYFKQLKNLLGFKGYAMCSALGIDSFIFLQGVSGSSLYYHISPGLVSFSD
jgi:hypothetical protein